MKALLQYLFGPPSQPHDSQGDAKWFRCRPRIERGKRGPVPPGGSAEQLLERQRRVLPRLRFDGFHDVEGDEGVRRNADQGDKLSLT
jgi:hypothetical protein